MWRIPFRVPVDSSNFNRLSNRAFHYGESIPRMLEQRFSMINVRFKKSRRRKSIPRVITPEMAKVLGNGGRTLQSVIGNPESPFTIARQIRSHINKLTSPVPTLHVRRKRDFGIMNRYRILSMAGMTHETPQYPFIYSYGSYVFAVHFTPVLIETAMEAALMGSLLVSHSCRTNPDCLRIIWPTDFRSRTHSNTRSIMDLPLLSPSRIRLRVQW